MTTNESCENSVVLMGGTFNPIHHGHLRTAVDILDKLGFDQVRLVPCFQPVHKSTPGVPPNHRVNMVEIATLAEPRLTIDRREIDREGASYTIDTLRAVRAELGDKVSLVLAVGMDSFLSLSTWREWEKLLSFAHLLVVTRPGWELDLPIHLEQFYEKHRVNSVAELQSAPSGRIHVTTLTPLAISSSQIRHLCQKKQSIAYLVPENVAQYIRDFQLYQKG